MAEQENNNKRAYIGIAIFAVLMLANLIVRGTRKPVTPVSPARPAVVESLPSTAPAIPTVTPAQPATAIPPVTGSLPLTAPLPTETTGIDEQILRLNQTAEELGQKIAAIPLPYPAPDLSVSLQTNGIDCLVWELTKEEIVQMASETVIIASVPRMLAIVGEFRVRGKKKLLIREDEKVFLLNASQTYNDDEMAVLGQENGIYNVRDTTGQTHNLASPEPDNGKLREVIETLKGLSRKQPGFKLAPEISVASQPATP